MTHEALKTKIDEGLQFTVHVADGRSFEVPHRDFVWLPPRSTFVVVGEFSSDDPEVTIYHAIPLLMVSGVTLREKPSETLPQRSKLSGTLRATVGEHVQFCY